MASDGVVWQIPSGHPPASLANDGNIKSCSKTKGSSVKFQVDIKEESIVTGLYIILGGMLVNDTLHVYMQSILSGNLVN